MFKKCRAFKVSFTCYYQTWDCQALLSNLDLDQLFLEQISCRPFELVAAFPPFQPSVAAVVVVVKVWDLPSKEQLTPKVNFISAVHQGLNTKSWCLYTKHRRFKFTLNGIIMASKTLKCGIFVAKITINVAKFGIYNPKKYFLLMECCVFRPFFVHFKPFLVISCLKSTKKVWKWKKKLFFACSLKLVDSLRESFSVDFFLFLTFFVNFWPFSVNLVKNGWKK